jgi:hypothetical protein
MTVKDDSLAKELNILAPMTAERLALLETCAHEATHLVEVRERVLFTALKRWRAELEAAGEPVTEAEARLAIAFDRFEKVSCK